MIPSLVLGQLFVQPLTLPGATRLYMLAPLCLSVAIVYKTIHCRQEKDIPLASVVLCVTILTGMMAVGAALYLAFYLLL